MTVDTLHILWIQISKWTYATLRRFHDNVSRHFEPNSVNFLVKIWPGVGPLDKHDPPFLLVTLFMNVYVLCIGKSIVDNLPTSCLSRFHISYLLDINVVILLMVRNFMMGICLLDSIRINGSRGRCVFNLSSSRVSQTHERSNVQIISKNLSDHTRLAHAKCKLWFGLASKWVHACFLLSFVCTPSLLSIYLFGNDSVNVCVNENDEQSSSNSKTCTANWLQSILWLYLVEYIVHKLYVARRELISIFSSLVSDSSAGLNLFPSFNPFQFQHKMSVQRTVHSNWIQPSTIFTNGTKYQMLHQIEWIFPEKFFQFARAFWRNFIPSSLLALLTSRMYDSEGSKVNGGGGRPWRVWNDREAKPNFA